MVAFDIGSHNPENPSLASSAYIYMRGGRNKSFNSMPPSGPQSPSSLGDMILCTGSDLRNPGRSSGHVHTPVSAACPAPAGSFVEVAR